jgi:hypothetical protein
MPSTPTADRSRKAHLILVTAAGACLAALLTSCATDRLATATPQGVNLSGEWRLNENLSDDPQRIDEPKELPPKTPSPGRNPGGFGKPGTTMPGMPQGPGGIDPGGIDPGGPGGGGENLTQTGGAATGGLVPVLYAQDTALPSSASDGGPAKPAAKTGRDSVVSHMLDAPALLTISQTGGKLVVKSASDSSGEEYTAGEQRTIPFGQTEADRSAGWRESAFVVITKAKKGPSKEDDFALDSEGHLIFATLVTHVKKGPIDFKRVYDRVRTP